MVNGLLKFGRYFFSIWDVKWTLFVYMFSVAVWCAIYHNLHRLKPNLDLIFISEILQGNYSIFETSNFNPFFLKMQFLGPKKVKTSEFFSDKAYDLATQSTLFQLLSWKDISSSMVYLKTLLVWTKLRYSHTKV